MELILDLQVAHGDPPKGWARTRLPEVARIEMGQSPPGSTYNESGKGLPFFQGKADFGPRHPIPRVWCTVPKKIAEAGDVLISVRAPVGPTNLADTRCIVGRGLAAIRPGPLITGEFLLYQLRLRESELAELGVGSTFTAVSKRHLLELEIEVAPLSEQRRIVAQVEALLARAGRVRARLAAVRTIMKRFRQAVLAAACSGRLTEDWREHRSGAASDPIASAPLEQSGGAELPEVPDSWKWRAVAEIGEVQGGIQKQPIRQPRVNHFPYLRVANVGRGRLDVSEIHRMEIFPGELERYRLEPDDLLIVEGNGSFTEIGRCAIWHGEIPDCVHQNHIIRVRVKRAVPEFVACYWNSTLGIANVAEAAVTTAGLYSLSTRKIARLPVPIPPTAEQHEIVRRVGSLFALADAASKRVQVASERADKLTQGMLAKAFRGELVPTDAELARQQDRETAPALPQRVDI